MDMHFNLLIILLAIFSTRAENLKKQCKGIQYDVVAHPSDNKMFILCSHEVPYVANCETNKCFDATIKSCSDTACQPATPSDEATAKDFCASQPIMTKYPAADCSYFWTCLSNDQPLHIPCPNGTHYSRFDQECVSPPLARCMAQEELCASNEATFQAESCHEYYVCQNKNLMKLSCPYGHAYNTQTGSCELDDRHTCLSPSKPNCKDTATVNPENPYFAHNDCSKFYICVQGEAYEGKCANGYGFDSRTSTCVAGVCH